MHAATAATTPKEAANTIVSRLLEVLSPSPFVGAVVEADRSDTPDRLEGWSVGLNVRTLDEPLGKNFDDSLLGFAEAERMVGRDELGLDHGLVEGIFPFLDGGEDSAALFRDGAEVKRMMGPGDCKDTNGGEVDPPTDGDNAIEGADVGVIESTIFFDGRGEAILGASVGERERMTVIDVGIEVGMVNIPEVGSVDGVED